MNERLYVLLITGAILASVAAAVVGMKLLLSYHIGLFVFVAVLALILLLVVAATVGPKEYRRRRQWMELLHRLPTMTDAVAPSGDSVEVHGAGLIESVEFPVLRVVVSSNGTRIERPTVDVPSLRIPWDRVKRLDLFQVGKNNDPSQVMASFTLTNTDIQFMFAPWNHDELQEHVPSFVNVESAQIGG